MVASDELRVMLRPFATFRALAQRDSRARWWPRPLQTLLVIGAFVSATTAGRFVAWHVLFVMGAWAFLPGLQLLWLRIVGQRWGRGSSFARSAHLFFAGQGGWLLVLLLIVALVTLAPGVADAIDGARWIPVMGVGVLFALFHGFVVSFAFFREVWGLTRRAALAASGMYYLGLAMSIVAYYLAMGQLLPIVTRTQ